MIGPLITTYHLPLVGQLLGRGYQHGCVGEG